MGMCQRQWRLDSSLRSLRCAALRTRERPYSSPHFEQFSLSPPPAVLTRELPHWPQRPSYGRRKCVGLGRPQREARWLPSIPERAERLRVRGGAGHALCCCVARAGLGGTHVRAAGLGLRPPPSPAEGGSRVSFQGGGSGGT